MPPSITSLALSTCTVAAASFRASGDDVLNKAPPSRRRMPYVKDLEQFMGDNYDPKTANWMSMSEDVQFLPVLNKGLKNKPRRKLSRSLEDEEEEEESYETTGAYANYDPYSVQPFVEGMTGYDEYQQAWRLLGFTIDCNIPYEDDDYQMSGGSQDGEITEAGCARYVLWAAYVDLEYEGGGIGEYQYWNRDNDKWDDTACYYAEGSSGDGDGDDGYSTRCAKMDCHLEDTHFSVLGFFKHRNYDDWFEQLFKHEGMCVWSEEEYAFMKNAREAWPKGCVDTETTATVGVNVVPLYYNIDPWPNGQIAFGLYTDEECVTEYPASIDMIENIIGNKFAQENSHDSGDSNYDFSGDTLAESMDRWDSAFDVWHTCHPCVAHDLNNTGGDIYVDDDNYNDDYNNRRKLGGEYSAQGDIFECYDDAGYTNVNQCMKFSAKTVMKTATFRDLSLGNTQGSLVEFPLSGYINASEEYQSHKKETFFMYFSLVAVSSAFLFSLFKLYKALKEPEPSIEPLTEELL